MTPDQQGKNPNILETGRKRYLSSYERAAITTLRRERARECTHSGPSSLVGFRELDRLSFRPTVKNTTPWHRGKREREAKDLKTQIKRTTSEEDNNDRV